MTKCMTVTIIAPKDMTHSREVRIGAGQRGLRSGERAQVVISEDTPQNVRVAEGNAGLYPVSVSVDHRGRVLVGETQVPRFIGATTRLGIRVKRPLFPLFSHKEK